MAKKPFYSLEEACATLKKNQDELKALVRDGTLREFRDAGKVFFRAEDVDKLAAKSAPTAADDTGEILLEATGDLEELDSGGSGDLPSLRETSGGTSIIGLEPLAGEEDSGGTKGGTKGGSGGPKKKGDTVISGSGIRVFDEEELEIESDPMAKTQITSGNVEDQISLEGAGSGSGLLDLAREADDTALGADLLDEIYPGEEEAAPTVAQKSVAPPPAAAAADEEAEEVADSGEALAPVIIATGDPHEGMMTGLLVAGLILMGLAATVMSGVMQGFLPGFANFLVQNTMYFWFYVGGSVVLAALALLTGWFLSRAFSPRRR
jgi:hypothetical protein